MGNMANTRPPIIFDRLVRIEIFAKSDASLVSISESLDTQSAAGQLVVNMLGGVAQWEREAIGGRTEIALGHKRVSAAACTSCSASISCVERSAHLEIDALSEGTRDQLVLALRLATLEQYLQEAESQPLILDDTFIAFDDPRAVRAFRALAEIAGQTQVLYFTHHAGCVEAARVGIPGVQIAVHNLHDVASIDERELATA